MTAVHSTRVGGAKDAIDGVIPLQIAQPATAEELAETLRWAASEKLTTVIRGGGTKLGWGRPPSSVDLIVSTASLNRTIVHRHGDLTATVDAGVTLGGLNRTLAQNGQWLPIDSAFEGATIGGILATNDSGPVRHRYGTPRDLLIGITLALTDGRLVKAGGNVVKNVAGYDLGRLVTGSFGGLAAIVDATFKLLPRPATSTTVAVEYPDAASLAKDVAIATSSQLEPEAFDVRVDASGVDGPAHGLLVRFASSPAATESQVAAMRSLISGQAITVTGDAERRLWREQDCVPWESGATVLRLAWLPARLEHVLAQIADARRTTSSAMTFMGRVGIGSGLLRLEGERDAARAAIEQLRSSADVGNVVVLQASRELKAAVDVWGAPADSAPVARALKQMFDPAGILNAGRGPI